MLTIKKFILFIILLNLFSQILASGYYISPEGNDGHNGLSKELAWKTIDKLNSSLYRIKPGDSILFKCNAVYTGKLTLNFIGSLDKKIYLGSYGDGEKPVICGMKKIGNWKEYEGNIWYTDINFFVPEMNFIFIDNEEYHPGRYPDEGFYYTTRSSSKKDIIICNEEKFSYGKWSGGEMVIRSNRWVIDRCKISNNTESQFYLKNQTTYSVTKDIGFFIQNHFHTLNKEGEWFYDKLNNRLFLYTMSDPNFKKVEIPYFDNGIQLNRCINIDIRGIKIHGLNNSFVKIQLCQKIRIQNIICNQSGRNGVIIENSDSVKILNSTFSEIKNNSVNISSTKNSELDNLQIKKVGTCFGLGQGGNGTYTGVYINRECSNLRIINNTIDSIGYCGIAFFRSDKIIISNNKISYTCLVKDDGAAIYTWSNNNFGNIIRNNNIRYSLGNNNGLRNIKTVAGEGIYIDDRSANINIIGNSISNCTRGIFIHNANTVKVYKNYLCNNKCNLLIKRDNVAGDQWAVKNCEVKNNVIYITSLDHMGMCVKSTINDDLNFGSFMNNVFFCKKNMKPVQISIRLHGIEKRMELMVSDWEFYMLKKFTSDINDNKQIITSNVDCFVGERQIF